VRSRILAGTPDKNDEDIRAVTEPTFPAGRYGRRRAPRVRRRWPTVLLAGVVAAAGVGLSVRLYQQYGQPDYIPTVTRFYDMTDDGVTVEFVVRKPSDDPATCRVRARARNGEEVGRAEVDVERGSQVRMTYRLATSKRPVTVEVPACGPLRDR
jgi:hypothetical protein